MPDMGTGDSDKYFLRKIFWEENATYPTEFMTQSEYVSFIDVALDILNLPLPEQDGKCGSIWYKISEVSWSVDSISGVIDEAK